jgi:SAM-dependent methyltransferase
MPEGTPTSSGESATPLDAFMDAIRNALACAELIELVLGKYRGAEADGRRILIRPVTLKNIPCLSFVTRQPTRDLTENLPMAASLDRIRNQLGNPYLGAHLFTARADVQLEFSRKGKGRIRQSAPTRGAPESAEHDRSKKRWIDPARPFLQRLGITDESHRVFPSMNGKWRQINHFIEIFAGALKDSPLADQEELSVVDFGCGKGYLTFALHDYLTHSLGRRAKVRGIEIRPDLVDFCRRAAGDAHLAGLTFECGDLNRHGVTAADVLIALHACDTATDEAIALGLERGAQIVICAPCCHKEIRPQLVAPEMLQPLLRHGIQAAQEAEMITDTLRALVLESRGFAVQIFEFIALEHTARNKMILAVQKTDGRPAPESAEQIRTLMKFYGIRSQSLVTRGGIGGG